MKKKKMKTNSTNVRAMTDFSLCLVYEEKMNMWRANAVCVVGFNWRDQVGESSQYRSLDKIYTFMVLNYQLRDSTVECEYMLLEAINSQVSVRNLT